MELQATALPQGYPSPLPRINIGVSWRPLRTVCSWYSNIDSGEGGIGIVPTLLTMIVDLYAYHTQKFALPRPPLSLTSSTPSGKDGMGGVTHDANFCKVSLSALMPAWRNKHTYVAQC